MSFFAVSFLLFTAVATVATFFASAEASASVVYAEIVPEYNSQNLEILSAGPVMQFGTKAFGGGDIQIVEGVALASDIGSSGTSVFSNGAKNNGKISLYEVREGDTLSQIAEMFDVSINTIRWANDFRGSIQPGQKLIILPVTGITHVVKNGGTINDVADIYDADVNEIALFNGLAIDQVLKKGDEVIVPYADLPEKHSDHDNAPSTYIVNSTGNSAVANGYYSHPLPGSRKTQGLHGYNGIDFGAPVGTSVRAAAPGKVITARDGGWNGGYGSMVVISHPNGTQTVYAHLSSVNVYVGQTVDTGEVIGGVGSTGRSTGPHLHFEIRGARNPF